MFVWMCVWMSVWMCVWMCVRGCVCGCVCACMLCVCMTAYPDNPHVFQVTGLLQLGSENTSNQLLDRLAASLELLLKVPIASLVSRL